MSETLERLRLLVARGDVRISLHGYEELAADGIHAVDIVEGLKAATVVEDYPAIQRDRARSFCSKIELVSQFM